MRFAGLFRWRVSEGLPEILKHRNSQERRQEHYGAKSETGDHKRPNASGLAQAAAVDGAPIAVQALITQSETNSERAKIISV
ncbi:MAG: hypothetical protein ACM3TN_25160 [Alphaproteobacteria bacterium]